MVRWVERWQGDPADEFEGRRCGFQIAHAKAAKDANPPSLGLGKPR